MYDFAQDRFPLLKNKIFHRLVVCILSTFFFDDSSFSTQWAGFVTRSRSSVRLRRLIFSDSPLAWEMVNTVKWRKFSMAAARAATKSALLSGFFWFFLLWLSVFLPNSTTQKMNLFWLYERFLSWKQYLLWHLFIIWLFQLWPGRRWKCLTFVVVLLVRGTWDNWSLSSLPGETVVWATRLSKEKLIKKFIFSSSTFYFSPRCNTSWDIRTDAFDLTFTLYAREEVDDLNQSHENRMMYHLFFNIRSLKG